jgi:predicted N-formylglutamate amidohydrolase
VGTVRVRGHMVDDSSVRQAEEHPSVAVINATGTSPFVLVCDHASNRIPATYDNLGLTPRQRLMHIAWDPGALGVAHELSELLDAPLVHSTVCRLVIDCNRDESAVDLVPVVSERTEINANAGISETERRKRIASYHAPFHRAIEAILDERKAKGVETILVTVHSFTPTYKDVWRPWEIGLIHGTDPSFTEALQDALREDDPRLNVGWNEPYSARNGVTYTLETHGDGRGLDATMIEIRHDEILEPEGVSLWAARLARCLERARGAFAPTPARTEQLGANRRPL